MIKPTVQWEDILDAPLDRKSGHVLQARLSVVMKVIFVFYLEAFLIDSNIEVVPGAVWALAGTEQSKLSSKKGNSFPRHCSGYQKSGQAISATSPSL